MSTIWAVARQMVAEGARMRVALVLLTLIGAVLIGLPFSIEGDNTVSGAVRSFLSYGLLGTGLVLSLLTIFMSRSLSDEFVHRQLYLIVSKPVPRWQYLMGKWLGISVLNLVYLSCAGMTIYGMVWYLRANPPNAGQPEPDRRMDEFRLTHEVLVARHVRPARVPADEFDRLAKEELDRNLEEGLYAGAPDFRPDRELSRLRKKYEARWRIVYPMETRNFEFDQVLCRRDPRSTVQLRYKTDVTQYAPDEIYRALWQFGDPLKEAKVYSTPVRHFVGRFHTVPVPATAVAGDQTLLATLFNQNPFEGEPQYRNALEVRAGSGPEVLFVVGSFEGNFLRLLVIMWCKLLFLAAVALLATTLFSYSVACLVSLTTYVLAVSRSFVEDALDFVSDDRAYIFTSLKEFAVQSIMYTYDLIQWVLPDFGRYNPIEDFVNGRNVSLVWVLQAVVEMGVVKTAMVLGLAMAFFYRREAAEVSF